MDTSRKDRYYVYVYLGKFLTFTCVDLELLQVAAVHITQAPDLEPSLDRLLGHVLLE